MGSSFRKRPDRRRKRGTRYRSFGIIYEDDDLLAVTKPDGMLVNMAESNEQTLQDQVRFHKPSQPGSKQFPAALHRLDRYTSGIVLFARHEKAAQAFSELLRSGEVEKYYSVLTLGIPEPDRGIIDLPLEAFMLGKKRMRVAAPDCEQAQVARTEFWLEETFLAKPQGLEFSLLKSRIYTGRTHQIRVHFAAHGHAVAGDTIYGLKAPNRYLREKARLLRQFIHARRLVLQHPFTGQQLELVAKLPKDLVNVLKYLRNLSTS